jgi:DNA-binding transcriptional LysR family regulator
VSEAIRTLESRLGAKLFERTSRRVRLTPAGAELQRKMLPICAALDHALAETSSMAIDVTGQLRVGITNTTDGPALGRLVNRFESLYPDCTVSIYEVDVWDPYAALRRGDADVIVNWLAVDETDLTVGPAIAVHRRVLAVANTHRLAARSSVPLEDLGDEEVGQPPPTFPAALCDALLPPSTPSGRPIRRVELTRSVPELLAHVARGKLVHPTVAAVSQLSRDDIVLVPIEDLPPLPLGLIWCTTRESPKIRAIANLACSLDPQTVN